MARMIYAALMLLLLGMAAVDAGRPEDWPRAHPKQTLFAFEKQMKTMLKKNTPQYANPSELSAANRLIGRRLLDNTPATPGDPGCSSCVQAYEINKPALDVSGLTVCDTQSLMGRYAFGGSSYYNYYQGTYSGPDPSACSNVALISLTWDAYINSGEQYDRIGAVWVGGVELIRTTTSEPASQGTAWSFSRDITQYKALLDSASVTPLQVWVELDNTVAGAYNQPYYVKLTLTFYSAATAPALDLPNVIVPVANQLQNLQTPVPGFVGYYALLQNNTAQGYQPSFSVTLDNTNWRNANRSVLEVVASAHGNEEFWVAGSSPYRLKEIRVFVNGVLAGVFNPYPTYYSGGINPGLWRPIVSPNAYQILTYRVDLTPFVAALTSATTPPTITLQVAQCSSYWLVDGNLMLWLDPTTTQTVGTLPTTVIPSAYSPTVKSTSRSNTTTSSTRSYTLIGTAGSSQTTVTQSLNFQLSNTSAGDYVFSATTTSTVTTKVNGQTQYSRSDNYVWYNKGNLATAARSVITSDKSSYLPLIQNRNNFASSVTRAGVTTKVNQLLFQEQGAQVYLGVYATGSYRSTNFYKYSNVNKLGNGNSPYCFNWSPNITYTIGSGGLGTATVPAGASC